MTEQVKETQLIKADSISDTLAKFEITTGGDEIAARYAPHFNECREIASEAGSVASDQPKAARALRLRMKAVRVDAEKSRKALKEDSLRRGDAIDGINKVLKYSAKQVEDAMEEIEKAEERAEAARAQVMLEDRTEQISKYAEPGMYNLRVMTDEQFAEALAGAKASHEAKLAAEAEAERKRIEAEKKAEADRIAAEKVAEEERKRLKKEAAESAKAAEAERKKREEAEALAAKEKAKAEAAKRKAEKKAAEEKAKADAERKRLEDEIAAREEAERKKREEAEALARVEAEKAAAAERKAAAAPDQEKLAAFAASVRGLDVPGLSSGDLAAQLADQVEKFASWIEKKSDGLGK